MDGRNRQLVARILLLSALVFAVLALVSWTGGLPVDPGTHRLFGFAFGICALADALIGLILLLRSSNS